MLSSTWSDEKSELTNRAMEPMVRALKPLANFSEWLWDFHINGEGRDLTFSIHSKDWHFPDWIALAETSLT